MKEASDNLYHTSKEKYYLKAGLIEKADDMTTKEKLDALNQNYDCHNQEVWRNRVIIGIVASTLLHALISFCICFPLSNRHCRDGHTVPSAARPSARGLKNRLTQPAMISHVCKLIQSYPNRSYSVFATGAFSHRFSITLVTRFI